MRAVRGEDRGKCRKRGREKADQRWKRRERERDLNLITHNSFRAMEKVEKQSSTLCLKSFIHSLSQSVNQKREKREKGEIQREGADKRECGEILRITINSPGSQSIEVLLESSRRTGVEVKTKKRNRISRGKKYYSRNRGLEQKKQKQKSSRRKVEELSQRLEE